MGVEMRQGEDFGCWGRVFAGHALAGEAFGGEMLVGGVFAGEALAQGTLAGGVLVVWCTLRRNDTVFRE